MYGTVRKTACLKRGPEGLAQLPRTKRPRSSTCREEQLRLHGLRGKPLDYARGKEVCAQTTASTRKPTLE